MKKPKANPSTHLVSSLPETPPSVFSSRSLEGFRMQLQNLRDQARHEQSKTTELIAALHELRDDIDVAIATLNATRGK